MSQDVRPAAPDKNIFYKIIFAQIHQVQIKKKKENKQTNNYSMIPVLLYQSLLRVVMRENYH